METHIDKDMVNGGVHIRVDEYSPTEDGVLFVTGPWHGRIMPWLGGAGYMSVPEVADLKGALLLGPADPSEVDPMSAVKIVEYAIQQFAIARSERWNVVFPVAFPTDTNPSQLQALMTNLAQGLATIWALGEWMRGMYMGVVERVQVTPEWVNRAFGVFEDLCQVPEGIAWTLNAAEVAAVREVLREWISGG